MTDKKRDRLQNGDAERRSNRFADVGFGTFSRRKPDAAPFPRSADFVAEVADERGLIYRL
jgi:hypothetical protein